MTTSRSGRSQGRAPLARAGGGGGALADSPPGPVVVGLARLDADGSCVWANESLGELVRWAPEALRQRSFGELVHPEDLDANLRGFLGRHSAVSFRRSGLRLRRGDGSFATADVELLAERDAGQRLQWALLVVVDSAPHKQLQAGLARRDARLETLGALLGHDLRSILNVVALHGQLVHELLADHPESRVRRSVETVVNTARSAAQLMSQLQDYAVGLRRDALERLSLQELVTGVLEQLDARIRAVDAVVEVGDLPSVLGREALLTQILRTILASALECGSPAGSVRVEIGAVSEATTRGRVGLVVRDSGRGDPAEEHAALRRALAGEPAARRVEETGIEPGLCVEHVSDVGGALWLEAREGAGTQIVLLLPAG